MGKEEGKTKIKAPDSLESTSSSLHHYIIGGVGTWKKAKERGRGIFLGTLKIHTTPDTFTLSPIPSPANDDDNDDGSRVMGAEQQKRDREMNDKEKEKTRLPLSL